MTTETAFLSSASFLFTSPRWFLGLTLDERLMSLREGGMPPTLPMEGAERADRRLARWRAERSLKGRLPLLDPVTMHGASEDELMILLGESVETLRDRSVAPAWFRELQKSYVRAEYGRHENLLFDVGPGVEFLVALADPIYAAKARLRVSAESIANANVGAPFRSEGVVDVLFEQLVPRLSRLLVRAFVVELHAARLAGQLEGEASEDRFQAFVGLLRDPARALTTLHEYPVLARLVMTALTDWVDASREFLHRLAADWARINATLEVPLNDVLTSVHVLGDRHKHGRAVLLATFDSGAKVVYKPRSVAAEIHFQELLRWLEERGSRTHFRRLRVVPGEGYGWCEFIDSVPCRSGAGLRRFFRRQGNYVALLYVLGASDFHYENVIAASEHPMLVDLECLFHGLPPNVLDAVAGAERVATEAAAHSVLNIGLLPRPALVGAESGAADVSGIGAVSGQVLPVRVPEWDQTATDEMRQILEYPRMGDTHHSPLAPDSDLAVRAFTDDVVDGFAEMYHLLWENRDALIASEGPVARFASDEMRFILRSTMDYGLLMDSALHPHFLRDGIDRDSRFDRLLGTDLPWIRPEIISAERSDLWRSDVPLFLTRPDSRHMWTWEGIQIDSFFAATGLEVFQRRMARLSESDLERQSWMVGVSVASAGLTATTVEYSPAVHPSVVHRADESALLEAARLIGDRVSELAIRADDEVMWLGLQSHQGSQWRIDPVGPDLYGGLAGIALFLSYLGRTVEDDRYVALARAAFPPLERQIERGISDFTCGGFDGVGGLIYALTHLGVLWHDPEPLHAAERLIAEVPRLLAKGGSADVVSGVAGCAAALLAVSNFLTAEPVVKAARCCGEYLLDSALETDAGLAWPAPVPGWKPLGGFAHGAAGIAWSLLRLSGFLRDRRLREAGLAAIAYQQSLFSPEEQNWLDLRETDKEALPQRTHRPTVMPHWCNGASGVGLAWLGCLAEVDQPALRRDIAVAVSTTGARGFGFNHSLCHGDLGNAEVLLRAEESGVCRTDVAAMKSEVLSSIRERGWLTGYPRHLEAPGFMMGLAGIGYGLLRLCAPDRVPSVLLMEPPRRGNT
jgi:type 2 lantibiotic biosynthesis protein LanM